MTTVVDSGIAAPRRWRAIAIGTALLVPAFWTLLFGLMTAATEGSAEAAEAGAAIALGLGAIPFVYVALALLSEQPRAIGTAMRATGLCLLVGIPVSAVAADGVTGLVAGIGAGGAVALRGEPGQGWQPRALGVVVATAYTFVLARAGGSAVLLPAPVFALTCVGLADHVAAWRQRP